MRLLLPTCRALGLGRNSSSRCGRFLTLTAALSFLIVILDLRDTACVTLLIIVIEHVTIVMVVRELSAVAEQDYATSKRPKPPGPLIHIHVVVVRVVVVSMLHARAAELSCLQGSY